MLNGDYSIRVHQGLTSRAVTPEKEDTANAGLLANNAQEKETKQQEVPTFSVNGWDVQANQYKAGLDVKVNRDAWIESIVNKYNNADQKARIEAGMVDFENGVNATADIIETEFPAMFSETAKNALAVNIFYATHQG